MLYLLAFLLSCMSVFAEEPQVAIVEQIDVEEVFSLSRQPRFDGGWLGSPIVYVCPNTPISLARVSRAIRVWERLGYNIVGPIGGVDIPECFGDSYRRGAILIKLRGQTFNEDNLAMTRTYRITETREIIAAVIQIQAFAPQRERVIEHEIGHAFGWNHFNRKLHLMHAIHNEGGWDTYGLRRRDE